MEIEYKGANCVTIKTGSATVITDPKLSLYGQKDSKVEGMIEAVTDKQFIVDDNEKLLISGPGEYEVSDISIQGNAAQRHSDEVGSSQATIYRIEVLGFRIAVLGHIAPNLTEDQLESLGVIDILILPVGGNGYTLDATGAAHLARQIDPKIVIPTHYADKEMAYPVPQESLEDFRTNLGATNQENTDKLKLKMNSALPEILTLIELTRH